MNNKINTNFHTHTYLCKHATGKPIDYVKKAVEFQYESIAITDHGPLSDEILKHFYSRRMSFKEFYNSYLPDLDKAIKEYHDQIKIYKGLEIEYFESMEIQYKVMLYHLDFLMLGQHYFLYKGNYSNVYDTLTDDEILFYGQVLTQAMETGLFKIVAHPDLFCISRRWDRVCEITARRIIKAAIDNKVVLEFNANGIRNCIRTKNYYPTPNGISYGYPRREFFEIVKEMNAPVMINDDSHALSIFNDQYTKQAYEMAEEIGLTIIKDFLK